MRRARLRGAGRGAAPTMGRHGVLFGVAFLCKQFALLPLVAVLAAAPGGASGRGSWCPPLVVVGCGLIPFAAVDPSGHVGHLERRRLRRGGEAHHGDAGGHDQSVGVDQARDRPRRACRAGPGHGAVGPVAGGRPPAVADPLDRAGHRLPRRPARGRGVVRQLLPAGGRAPACSCSTWPPGACPCASFLWIALDRGARRAVRGPPHHAPGGVLGIRRRCHRRRDRSARRPGASHRHERHGRETSPVATDATSAPLPRR